MSVDLADKNDEQIENTLAKTPWTRPELRTIGADSAEAGIHLGGVDKGKYS
ncbi:MAG: hypothetical protein JSR60_18855 [Proteobacteria bacterium]|nr:hypothetical protein [Pseudomonadota bacterium]